MTIIMQQVLLLLQLIALVTSLPQSQSTEIIENQENVETGLPMAQALVDGENSDLGKLLLLYAEPCPVTKTTLQSNVPNYRHCHLIPHPLPYNTNHQPYHLPHQ